MVPLGIQRAVGIIDRTGDGRLEGDQVSEPDGAAVRPRDESRHHVQKRGQHGFHHIDGKTARLMNLIREIGYVADVVSGILRLKPVFGSATWYGAEFYAAVRKQVAVGTYLAVSTGNSERAACSFGSHE